MSNALSSSISASGKQIFWLPKDDAKISKLKRAARSGNYYAALAMKQLQQLSTGAVHNSNVFIPNINNSRASTFHMFSVYLPGIRADLERRSNDTYKIMHLELDASYDNPSKTEVKPGFYECESKNDDISVKFRSNKNITAEEGRTVIICSSKYDSPEEAALQVLARLEDIAGDAVHSRGKFDIYFAPQESAPAGMRRFRVEKNTQATIHSSILSKAMDIAKKKESVFWASIDNGSAILTQSIETLYRRQVSFSTAKHNLRFINPTTDPRSAINHAKQMGLKIHPTKTVQSGSIRVMLACAMSLRRRAMDNSDPYTLKQLGTDTAQGTLTCVATVGVGLFVAGLTTTNPIVLGAGTVVSGIGAMQTARNVFKKVTGK